VFVLAGLNESEDIVAELSVCHREVKRGSTNRSEQRD
jgi:hypothetical protein